MYQKDFILRMIEMIGDFILALLGQIRKGDYQQAQEALEGAYITFLREDATFFRAIPLNELTNTLIQEHNYTHGHLEILGELFFAEGELLFTKGKKAESLEFFQKSLLLLEFIMDESNAFSFEKQKRQQLLQQRIKEGKSGN